MKFNRFLFLPLSIALLGFGCANEYGTKESSQPPVESSTTTLEIKNGSSEKLDPTQSEYTIVDRSNWYQTLHWPESCEDDFRSSYDPETGDLAFYPITDNQYLLRVTCSISAYQESMVFIRVRNNNSVFSGEIVDLKTYDPIKKQLIDFDNEGTHQVAGFEKFNNTNKTLKLYTKARGLGDCGSYHDYQITATDTILIKMTAQDCEVADAWHLKHPDDINLPPWPTIYEKK